MNKQITVIRRWLAFFILILFLSGLTAIPVDTELSFLIRTFPLDTIMHKWLEKVLFSYRQVNLQFPFLLYGYDWLAFAHFVLAILFIGPYLDPIRNIWVIQFGMIACILVFPLAFIAGHYRGIPSGWQLIDCSFGVFGFVPLWICHNKTKEIISKTNT